MLRWEKNRVMNVNCIAQVQQNLIKVSVLTFIVTVMRVEGKPA